MINCESIAQYFSKYIKAYNKEFKRFVTPQPEGAGYPNLICSPYLYAKEFNIYIARDGVIVLVHKRSIPDEYTNKGPIINIRHSIWNFDEMWSGELPIPTNTFDYNVN